MIRRNCVHVKLYMGLRVHILCFYRATHPVKVHVWAGISRSEATKVKASWTGSERQNSQANLLPFIKTTFPFSHRFMQDNNPKQTSAYALEFMQQEGINWWKTPAESTDLKPIDNLWHELKEFIWRGTKPKTKDELVEGIEVLGQCDYGKCNKYIWISHRLLSLAPYELHPCWNIPIVRESSSNLCSQLLELTHR